MAIDVSVIVGGDGAKNHDRVSTLYRVAAGEKNAKHLNNNVETQPADKHKPIHEVAKNINKFVPGVPEDGLFKVIKITNITPAHSDDPWHASFYQTTLDPARFDSLKMLKLIEDLLASGWADKVNIMAAINAVNPLIPDLTDILDDINMFTLIRQGVIGPLPPGPIQAGQQIPSNLRNTIK